MIVIPAVAPDQMLLPLFYCLLQIQYLLPPIIRRPLIGTTHIAEPAASRASRPVRPAGVVAELAAAEIAEKKEPGGVVEDANGAELVIAAEEELVHQKQSV